MNLAPPSSIEFLASRKIKACDVKPRPRLRPYFVDSWSGWFVCLCESLAEAFQEAKREYPQRGQLKLVREATEPERNEYLRCKTSGCSDPLPEPYCSLKLYQYPKA